ncbi:MAG TPA: ATP-binding cassette domain-containing protein [Lentibacillus sp.]|uniref:energy-coupling factor ABC transporter ATP-binding protein n=1 Tax=Lentibacillus sp. TaxID=1925746 RepID=UPI002B4B65F3|nr:ATP-binding cassette domain-containing protein [Lentibacillus sp.]HLR61805.1 ATP-binding cassette domain-containing protein [Lentibacillus sp.]
MSIVDVEGLKYKYPDTDKLVLDDISFKVEKGEFIGLIGRNTAGKSSLCFALSGLIPHFFKGAYGGKVLIDGAEIKQHDMGEIAANIGLVFENPFSQMTGSKYSVYEEIAFGLENIGIEREKMISRIDESLELLDITAIKDNNPFDLSGGQMQRVAIASVIAMRPDVLILDEPTSQLDPQGSAEVFKVVENLTNEGITIIMAEHKMEKVSQYADKVLLLDNGKIIDYDTPANVFSRDDLLEFGIAAPVVTRVAKALGIKDAQSGEYPVTLAEISRENW